MANVTVCLGDFYQGLLGCNMLCGHNEALGCIVVTQIELQVPDTAIIVSSHIFPPTPEPMALQIPSTTFKVKGVWLGPRYLKELKANTMQ